MAASLSQNFEDRVLLEPVERVTAGFLRREGWRPLASYLVGQLARPDLFFRAVNGGASHHIAQLAYVARPGILLESFNGFRCKAPAWVMLLQKEDRQRPDIFATFPQRRNADLDGIQAVVQVGAELPPPVWRLPD